MMRTIVTLALFVATLASAQGLESVNGYVSKQDSLLQDYDYFFSQLEQIHPDPYSAYGGKDGFGKDTLVSLPFYPNGPFWENIVWTSTDERFPKRNFEYRFVDDCKQTIVMCIPHRTCGQTQSSPQHPTVV